MAKKLAFVYSHGGSVFDKNSHDGLNERGRNIVRSVRSAIECGADRVFISEAVYPGRDGQINILFRQGHFSGIEDKLDVSEYAIAEGVPFPKNYLMNRAAQKAEGFLGLVFSDSDVLYDKGFPKRAVNILGKCDFAQPDHVIYLDPHDNRTTTVIHFSMKRFHESPEVRNYIIYWEGMPGLCNIVKRDTFLSIGGFSQAMSGVNNEDVEYFIRLKILKAKMGFMENEIVRHIYHSRSFEVRKAEGLPSMFMENTNFICWWYLYLGLETNTADDSKLKKYLSEIKKSLEANRSLTGAYTNLTGTITPEFDPNKRYKLETQLTWYCYADPWSELGSKDVQCAAIIAAAEFWRVPVEEALALNKEKFHRAYSITIEDIYEYQKRMRQHEQPVKPTIGRSEESEKIKAMIKDAIRAAQKRGERRSGKLAKEMKTALGEVSEEKKRQSEELANRMKKVLRKKARAIA